MADRYHQQATLPKTPKRKREDGDGESEESAPLCCHKHEQQDEEEHGEALMAADHSDPKWKREDEDEDDDDDDDDDEEGEDDDDDDDEEEDDDDDEEEEDDDDDDDHEDKVIEYGRDEYDELPKADPQVWANYCKQVAESEGFDIEDFPGECAELMCGSIIPLKNPDKSQYEVAVRLAKAAIEDYNSKTQEAYQFESVVKINGRSSGGYYYYVTFRVKNLKAAGDSCDSTDENLKAAGDSSDDSSNENLKTAGDSSDHGDDSPLEIFQAEAWESFDESELSVFLCRPKPKK